MTDPNSSYHRAIAAELDRQSRSDDSEYDDERPIDDILSKAFQYLLEGKTVKAGAMIITARSWVQRNAQKNSMQRDIEEFMERADQHVALYPQLPDDKVKVLRIRLMVEELMGSTTPDEYEGLIANKSDELIQSILHNDLVGIADGIADVLYVVIGTAVAYGINIQEVFDEVHRSNLSKTVWDEDLQRYTIEKDEYGKGIKPPTYSPAALEPIVLRQIAEGERHETLVAELTASDEENASVTIGVL